ncbi:MAG: hypothetical protein ACI35T_07845 [Alistipes sp.]
MNRISVFIHKAAPTLTAMAIFFIVSVLCYAPQFEGRVLAQHDVQQFDGMSRDIRETRAEYGEDPQWTGAMFGGMPAYLINIRYPAQIIKHSTDWLLGVFDGPAGLLFWAMAATWLMTIMMGMSAWIGIVVGLAYGLSTYFMLIIGAGHITKMWALVYAPAMIGAIYMTLRGRKWLGGALAALFASLETGANHPQITYYFLLAAAALWLNDLIFAVRERHLIDFAKRTGILVAAAILAAGSNFAPLLYTAKHTQTTIRGGSELVAPDKATRGLDLQYATAWSYGLAESWNMIIPDFAGGDSGKTFARNGQVADSLKDLGLSEIATQLPTYWGGQPYTAGPTYLGAVAVLLALLGAILADSRDRWWIIAVSLLSVVLAWGHNCMWFTEFCFKYLPLYNKFRTVSMSLVAVEWSVPLLAGIGLWQLWQKREDAGFRRRAMRALAWAGGITGGIVLLFAVAGDAMFDFGREESGAMMSDEFRYMFEQTQGGDEYIRKGFHDELGWEVADAMARERADKMSTDAWRSLLFIALTSGVIVLYTCGRERRNRLLVALLAGLTVADMLPVNLRYAPYDKFVAPRRAKIQPTAADKQILEDRSLGYRVLNLSVSPFNDATTSMFHRSVGGYHGAKLGRYQDVIDCYLSHGDEAVLDMLNTKYIITRRGEAVLRESANGAAWFVDAVAAADDARAEIALIGEIDLKHTAAISSDDAGLVPASLGKGEIELTEYRPNYLKYEYTADAPALAVFSEIYYPDGWTMCIDGNPVVPMRADYILRAAVVPEGRHTVEWRFKSTGWALAEGITLICSLLIIAALISAIIYHTKYEKTRCCTSAQSA